ncbi:hypothetical protein BKA64DRAFT_715257 [Cadophora sp. MPI-SDFR-AT-0126]|nr:hypothetical protein BKA64DRAFT_715257 [Leotiomycetes sp. MPI-SDFR-AT-0126]
MWIGRWRVEIEPSASFCFRPGLAKTSSNPGNTDLLTKIQSYLQNGGAVIFGLHFPSFVTNTFDSFFEESFRVTWKRGDYQRATFQVNTFYTLPRGVVASSLPSAYSMKALHVRGAKLQENLFVPIPGAKTQSAVFAPADVDQSQAAIVGTRIGNEFLAYVGDVNGEEECDAVVLALCGL